MGWQTSQDTLFVTAIGKREEAMKIDETKINDKSEYEEIFELAARQNGLAFWRYDIASKTISYHGNVVNVYGYSGDIDNVPESLIEDGAIHPDDVQQVLDMYSKVSAGEKTASSVARWKNGETQEWFWSRINYTTIFDDDGKPVGAIGSSVDVTEEKTAQMRYQMEVDYRRSVGKNLVSSHRVNLTRGIVEESQSAIHKKALQPNSIMNNEIFEHICDISIPD